MRAACVDKNGVKKGAWTEEEDSKLRAYILRYGHWNWRLLPKFAGLARCGKSCRLRWMNYLKPGLKLGNYSKEEEALIAKLHDELGNKWSAIAEKLPGRTDNEIKNYWHTHLKKPPTAKRVCKKISKEASSSFQESPIPILESSGSDLVRCRDSEDSVSSAGEIQTSLLSDQFELPVLAETFHDHWNDQGACSSFDETFWTQPFQVDSCYIQNHEILSPFDQEELFLW